MLHFSLDICHWHGSRNLKKKHCWGTSLYIFSTTIVILQGSLEFNMIWLLHFDSGLGTRWMKKWITKDVDLSLHDLFWCMQLDEMVALETFWKLYWGYLYLGIWNGLHLNLKHIVVQMQIVWELDILCLCWNLWILVLILLIGCLKIFKSSPSWMDLGKLCVLWSSFVNILWMLCELCHIITNVGRVKEMWVGIRITKICCFKFSKLRFN